MGTLVMMSVQGDTRLMWDAGSDVEVANARRTFDDLRKKGFFAYRVLEGEGKKGEQINEFDPSAQKIIMAPPMRGEAEVVNEIVLRAEDAVDVTAFGDTSQRYLPAVWKIWVNGVEMTASNVNISYQASTTGAWTTSLNLVWNEWNAGTTTAWPTFQSQRAYTPPPPPTPEQIAAREAERAERFAAQIERDRARDEAQRTAIELLREALTASQLKELDRDGEFTVPVSKTRRYRLHSDHSSVVCEERRSGRWVRTERLCIHASNEYPAGDNALAQKLLVETDEAAFRRIANITRIAPTNVT